MLEWPARYPGCLKRVLNQVADSGEMSAVVNQAQRARILRELFDSYYADVDRPVVFDTSRSWTVFTISHCRPPVEHVEVRCLHHSTIPASVRAI